MILFCFRFPVKLFGQLSGNTLYLLSPRLCFLIVLKRDLFVYHADSQTRKRVTMRTEQATKCVASFQKLKARFAAYNMLKPPPPPQYFITDRSNEVNLLWCLVSEF